MQFTQGTLKRGVSALVVGLSLVYAIHMTAVAPRWLVDDSYIVFRYAENLAHHGALTWNVGEKPVEGYTGAALPVLLAIGMKLGIPPAAAAHALGVSFYFLGGALILLVLGGFNFGSAIALMLYFTAPFMFTHEWSGLETTMFATAMLLPIYAFVSQRRGLFLFSILFLSFVRPEGVPLAIVLLLLYRPSSWKSILVYVVPFAAYTLWRSAYYGELLPNTYYAKHAGFGIPFYDYMALCVRRWLQYGGFLLDSANAVRSGTVTLTYNLSDLYDFWAQFLLKPMLAALVVLAWGSVRKHRYLNVAIAAFCLFCVTSYLSFKLEMNFSHRFFVPFYPMAILALGGLMKNAGTSLRLVLAVVFLIMPQMRTNLDRGVNVSERRYASTYKQMLEEEHVAIGTYLREKIAPGEWLIVYADAGAVPYYAKLKTIDFGGLNDAYLARKKPGVDEARDYFFSRNAAAVVLTEQPPSIGHDLSMLNGILRDPRFGRYSLQRTYGSSAREGYFQELYIRKDLLPL
ncbi:MAG: hypothetical protein ABR899_06615 [Candidatus Krumholzibacteriaceae bacterium]